ncbi:MAG: glycosyltransferase family 4 protein [Xenococcaceae cyanobacterium]
MNRILVLSELYYPEQTSTGYLLTKTAEGLAEEFTVKVIAGPATNFLKSTDAPENEVRNNVEIFRCQGTSFDKDSLFGRLVNLVTRSLTIFWKTLTIAKKDDCIFVVTNPPLLPFVALLIKWLKGCQIVLLIHDVYPEVIVATGLSKSDSPLVKIGQIMNRFLYNQSDRIVTLGRDMSKLALAKLKDKNINKIHCIPNWADNDAVKPIDRASNPLLKEIGVSDRFVILYAGNMGRTHGIEYLAEAAKSLKNNPNIHFVVLGFGAKRKWLEEFVTKENLRSVTILAPRPRSEQTIFLNACDVALISFVPGMAGVSVPSRTYNQMAAGKPIIAVADDWSELAEVVTEEKIGWVISPGDIEGLTSAIETAANNRELCQQMGKQAANVAQTKYDFKRADRDYKKLFKDL